MTCLKEGLALPQSYKVPPRRWPACSLQNGVAVLQKEHRFLYCCSLFCANRMPVGALQSLMGPILTPGTSPQTSFLRPLVEGIGHLPS